jgi:hypothetical protein
MIHMFDAALSMLGPDTETLNEILTDLGKRHIKYGVLPHFFPSSFLSIYGTRCGVCLKGVDWRFHDSRGNGSVGRGVR